MQQQALTAQNELQKNQVQAQGDSIKAAGQAKAIPSLAEAQSKANEMLARSVTANLVQYEMAKKMGREDAAGVGLVDADAAARQTVAVRAGGSAA